MRSVFAIQDGLVYLDHGGYSLPLHDVLRQQAEYMDRINRNPSQFFRYALIHELAEVRRVLAPFLQCEARHLCFLPNATHAMVTLLQNLQLGPGDAVLMPELGYHGTRHALRRDSMERGFSVIEAPIPLPVASPQDLMDAIQKAWVPAVKVAIIDHISSPTSLVFPVQEICRFLRDRGVTVIIDGAQSPGQLPIHLQDWDCDFFIGNGHKWLTAPRTSAFLYVADRWLDRLHGLITGRADDYPALGRSRIQMETDWPGAYDPVPILCLPVALQCLQTLYPGGLDQLYRENHQGLCRGLAQLAGHITCRPVADVGMFGSMATVELLDAYALGPKDLQERLFAGGVAAQVFSLAGSGRLAIRVCHQAYVKPDDYAKLARILLQYRSL